MFNIRMFYEDAATAEVAGIETVEQPQPKQETSTSIASLMATAGKKMEAGKSVSDNRTKDNTTNKGESVKPVERKSEKAEPAAAIAETTAKAEPTPPSKEESKDTKKEIPESPTPLPTWQEVLKSQQPEAVLREIGFDDEMLEILGELSSYEQKKYFANFLRASKQGNQNAYLREWSTDYNKMSSEEVMKHQLRNEYPKASEKQLEALFKKEILEKYNLNSEDPDEQEEGRLLLDAKADNYRDKMIANQKEYLMPQPKPTEDLASKQAELEEQRQQKDFEAYQNKIENDPYSREVLNKGEIVIGEGKNQFKYKINPNQVREVLYDAEKWAGLVFDIERNTDGSIKSSNPKVKNQILTAAFAIDPENFLKEYAKHYTSVGSKNAIEPIENAKEAKQEIPANADVKPKNAAEAMAKFGKKVSSPM